MDESITTWRKSTLSGATNCVEVGITWRKSTFSSYNECVEVATAPDQIAVRDSKNSHGGVLRFAPAEWNAFLAGAKAREFDLLP